ncbi:type I restriction enzyme, R subunit [Mameliella alba]|uniref:type I restriction endonuclease subunit R n=1 Tax=Mameliella alba TaxID=561184 RepID=UPI00088FE1FF|nr:type I restriction endonuclease subunit R [Mameliella alba]OWV40356.1 restriction endonuclease subunit R [Mameliella alba]PTR33194.1 type I restriction enzyme R subunit [Mameliella alba]GGF86188.1 DEAD/DEAH box helicase [Mameliella alba]SDE34604.1 type I restriction enzyme, R subunit [Mameliella alba]
MSSQTFNSSEKHQSQVPALQLLVALGFTPLSQEAALRLRGGRLRNVVLDDVLAEQLMRINRFTHRGRAYAFDLEDAHEAMRRLKPTPDRLKGLRGTNQDIYDTLVLGTTITKSIDGDSKSYSFRYIDWERPENNVFHVTAEFSVERTASSQTKRCDIVAFVNGIPILVIENKRPTESLKKADSQLIGYQNEDNIPQLFHFAQLLIGMNRSEARYATVGTPRKFWQTWRDEEDTDEAIAPFANRVLTAAEKDAIFSGDFAGARAYFDALAAEGERAVTVQDRTVYALCRPERLLDLIRRFTVFDGGVRKVARHQQFFGIRRAVETVKQHDVSGARKGGVIWHTQGSGKSLTMVMLGRSLALERSIENPRIIIVTDRDDLDKQIKDTFKSCDLEPVRATSGAHLLDLVHNKAPLVTTIINKFDTALKNSKLADEDPNIFVLVDESHRTQTGRYGGHSQFAAKMRRLLPKACYLGFTGTPLLKKEKNTLSTFGRLIHRYAIDEAVADGAVVPLLYEGRLVEQQVSGAVIDRWFDKISEGLTENQKRDLKRKFSRMDALAKTDQAIRAKAFDISEHYRQYWQGTGFKAQLVAPSKAAAVRFKEVLDEIGHVSSAIVISPPDENEGNEEVDQESKDLVRRFWSQMMARHETEEHYNRQIIGAFKGSGDPEILIVVSKLLTGFDAPRNTVLYVCKSLKEHNLLQAIARVNRLYEDDGTEKQFGFIVDYEGLLGKLDSALTTYSAFEGYEAADLVGTVHDVREEIRKLPQLHDQLWDLFKPVRNKKDMEQFEQHLADEALRHEFYARLKAYSRCLHISLSSDKLFDVFDEAKVDALKRDWKQFSELKRSVQLRYQETVDVREFEPKIQKLLDDHVVAMPAETIIEVVNINDPDALKAVVEETGISEASRADRIASATRRAITEKMDEDPTFYKQFSALLEETIRAYREKRLSERDYLNSVVDLASKVARKDRGRDVPESIRGDEDAQAFFGILNGQLKTKGDEPVSGAEAASITLEIIDIIKSHLIVDIWSNEVAQNNLRNAIDDYFFDVLRDENGIDLPVEMLDNLELKIMGLARARFAA